MIFYPRAFAFVSILFLSFLGCGSRTGNDIVAIDGSSTVYPITEAVAEEFQAAHPARVTIGVSGTGGGFKKFCQREISITGASRPIAPAEVQACSENGVDYIELPVAYDGIAVVVHTDNDWVDFLTVEELQNIWRPEAQGTLIRWDQLRPEWPDEEIHLFGPGVDSGTYDYFTAAVVGKQHASRGDFTSSEDDNVLVHGVSTDLFSLGYFGFAYYDENRDKLKLVPIDDGNPDNGQGAIVPSTETVASGTYQPLSRPLFIYVRADAAERPEVERFVRFYLNEAGRLVPLVGYIAFPSGTYEMVLARFQERKTGSVMGGEGAQVGLTVEEMLNREPTPP
jgi:phosphate transport system substrate-binding protein